MKLSVKEKKNYGIVFIITLIMKLLFLCQHANYGINQDRIGDLIAPASLTGRDWSLIIPKVKYYGYGFKWIYSVFMAFTDDPYKIYYAIMLMYCVLMALTAVLVYHIITAYFGNVHESVAKVLAIFMGLVGLVDMKSESSVYMATWIAAFILVKAIYETDKKKKNRLAIVMALFLAYSLTLHERMLAMILGFAIAYVLYRIKLGEWFFSPVIYAPTQIISYILVRGANNLYRKHFWGTTEVGNSSAIPSNLGDRLYFIQSLEGFKFAIKFVWSNLVTLIMQTYGLAIIALMLFAISFFIVWKKKNEENRYVIQEKAQFALVWFGGISAAIVIAGMVVSWGNAAYLGDLYSHKGFVYGRYYVNFAYPAILGAVCWCDTHKVKTRHIVEGWACGILGIIVFLKSIYPTLEQVFVTYVASEYTSDTSLYWILYYRFDTNGSIRDNFIIDVLIIFVSWGFITYAWKKSRACTKGLAIVLPLVVLTMLPGMAISKPSVIFSGDVYGAVYSFYDSMEQQNVSFASDVIYTDSNAWPLQYMLNRYRIVYDVPAEDVDEVVFVSTNSPDIELTTLPNGEAYSYISVADNQYIYYKGEQNSNAISAMGYEGQPVVVDTAENLPEDTDNAILTLNERTIQIPEADREYKIVIVNDLHIITPDSDIADEYKELVSERYESMKNANGEASVDTWDKMSREINDLNADLVIFAGDMVDYASEANFECLKQGMENIEAPIMYLRSDHDYSRHYTADAISETEVIDMQSELAENNDVQIYDLGSFVVLGINNSWKSISDDTLNSIENLVSEGKPLVVATHVPWDTYYDSSYRETSLQIRGMYNMWGIGDRYTPDDNMTELMKMLYQDESPFRAVVTGHLHYQYDTMLTAALQEITFAPAYEGNVGVLNIVP